MKRFRVIVHDLEADSYSGMEVAEGDYVLIDFAPCRVHHEQMYANGTRVLTLKDWRPAAPAQVLTAEEVHAETHRPTTPAPGPPEKPPARS